MYIITFQTLINVTCYYALKVSLKIAVLNARHIFSVLEPNCITPENENYLFSE